MAERGSGLRLLVAEGNVPADRQRVAESVGCTPAEGYAAVLRELAPGSVVDICCPADGDPGLPGALESFHGVVVTGSALNIHKREPASLRQIDFARAVFSAGVPMFGSCWGLQLAAVAAGGDVARNPRGREVAFARKLVLTGAGRDHPMHAGRPPAFDAPAIHGDEVTALPEGAVVTAGNAVSPVQAADIRHGRGVFWGVQYHPEYGLHDVAATVRRYGLTLVEDGLFATLADLDAYADDLDRLDRDAGRRDIAWRMGLGDDILDPVLRRCEIANWLARQVLPGLGR